MQKKTDLKKALSQILCIVLIAAIALFTTGCQDNTTVDNEPSTTETLSSLPSSVSVIGEGKTSFLFTVIDFDGNETVFKINTDKSTVGEALLELNLIEGEAGQYGLYVKTVNGITADYTMHGKYWAFYVNGEYASSGVDTTTIEQDSVYSFRVE